MDGARNEGLDGELISSRGSLSSEFRGSAPAENADPTAAVALDHGCIGNEFSAWYAGRVGGKEVFD